jgi:hypothetical protein
MQAVVALWAVGSCTANMPARRHRPSNSVMPRRASVLPLIAYRVSRCSCIGAHVQLASMDWRVLAKECVRGALQDFLKCVLQAQVQLCTHAFPPPPTRVAHRSVHPSLHGACVYFYMHIELMKCQRIRAGGAWCVAILLRHAVRERGKRHPVSACQHGRTPARTLIALCVSHWSDRPQPGSSCVRAQAPKNAQCGVWCVTVSIVQSAYVTACLCYSLQHHSNGAIQRHSCMTQVLWSYFNPNDRVHRCLYHRVCGDDHNFVECESRRGGRYPSCTDC